MAKVNENVRNALAQTQVEPLLVLEIDGVPTIFSTAKIERYIRIGDPDLRIDGSWVIGGLTERENQENLITFQGTSTQIRQSLSPDSGAAGTVSSVQVTLVDKDGQLSRLITPGQVIPDLLGARAKLFYSFRGTSYPEDAVTVFRGVVTDILSDPASISLVIDHPDTLKRQKIFRQAKSEIHPVIESGVIGRISLANSPVGYFQGDVLTVTGGNGDARIKISKIEGGLITELQIENGGTGYSVASDVECTGGSGTGFRINIDLIGALDQYGDRIPLVEAANFLLPVAGPDGEIDVTFECYARIGDEIVRYTGKDGNTLTGCERGARDTIPAQHEPGSEVTSFYIIRGSAMEIALKLMLSGHGDYYSRGVGYSMPNYIGSEYKKNAIYFEQIDINELHGVVQGDFVTLEGSGASNDFEMRRILEVGQVQTGSYIVIDGDDLNDDALATGTLSFRSQFDSWPSGLKMHPEYVDVDEHLRIHRLFLSSFEYEFYLKDTLDGKEFMEKEVYLPAAAYSVPRQARSSVAYTTGPIPGSSINRLDRTNVVAPAKIRLRRTIAKNFYNQVAYRFDEKTLENGFSTNVYSLNADSLTRIPVGIKTLTIDSKGLRSWQQGESRATQASNRKLSRFSHGAEHFDSIEVQLSAGFEIEIGDIVIFDTTGLGITNTQTGDRAGFQRLFEVVNKTMALNTGKVTVTLLDTNIKGGIRHGLISPSSRIKSAEDAQKFMIEPAFPSRFGQDEFKKWSKLTNPAVRIRSGDFVIRATARIKSIELNIVELEEPLPFIPGPGYRMEFAPYPECTPEQRLIYAFMRDEDFEDGERQYSMI